MIFICVTLAARPNITRPGSLDLESVFSLSANWTTILTYPIRAGFLKVHNPADVANQIKGCVYFFGVHTRPSRD
jgi:hypothetical protein